MLSAPHKSICGNRCVSGIDHRNYLLAAQCVIAEHLRLDSVDDDNLVRLGPAGFVHLDLVANINHLAAVAEDTWFSDRLQAERVVNRIRSADLHLHIRSVVENASEVVRYLDSVRNLLRPPNGPFMEDDLIGRLTDLTVAKESVERMTKSQVFDPWFDARIRLRRGSRQIGVVINVVRFGCFIELENGLVGLAQKKYQSGLSVSAGDSVEVSILWIDARDRKMGLKILSVIEEEVGDVVGGQRRLFS